MRAAAYSQPGPPETLRYVELPDPAPGEGEILVAVDAIPIEGGDVIARRVVTPQHPDFVLGYQAGGRVAAVGPGATRFRVGERVATFNTAGSHADLRVVPEHYAWRIPEGLDPLVGASAPTTFGTADDSLFSVGGLEKGQTVLIQGAGGGVGVAAVQLARDAGARVIGTASRDETLARLGELGLTHGINHRTESIEARVREITGGEGVDLVLDMAGGAGFEALTRSIRRRGRLVSVGAATGEFNQVSLRSLVLQELAVCGIFLLPHLHTGRVRAIIDRHMAGLASGALQMPVATTIPLRDAARAHRTVEEGHPYGRVVMTTGD